MDNDDIRRGQASNHIKFNEATAILTGDALQALAYETIASSTDLTDLQKIESIKALTNACGHNGMILGQQYDLDAESDNITIFKKFMSLKLENSLSCNVSTSFRNEKQDNERRFCMILERT